MAKDSKRGGARKDTRRAGRHATADRKHTPRPPAPPEAEPAAESGDARSRLRGIVATGQDYYRRGTMAVVQGAADNSGLTLLVAGAAIGAVSWLLLGRRGDRDAE